MKTARLLLACFAAAVLCTSFAHAAPKTWNAGVNNTWDTATTANWTGLTWASGDDAIFGAAGVGVVNITGAGVTANSVTFNTAGYTIGGGTLNLNQIATTLTANENATINSAIGLTTAQNWSVAAGKNLMVGGLISGGGSLLKTGGGTGVLTLTNNNTYTGGTIVDNGVLVLQGDNGANGTIVGELTINSGAEAQVTNGQWTLGYDSSTRFVDTININGGALNFVVAAGGTNAQTFNLTGGLIIGTKFDLYNHFTPTHDVAFNTFASPDTSTVSAGINLRIGESVGGGALNFNVADGAAATDLAVSGTITGSSASRIVKNGAGLMTLSGPNTYAGSTTINDGTLSISSIDNGSAVSNIGTSSSAAANLVLGGGTLEYTGLTASTNRSFTLTNGTSSTFDVANAATNLTISGGSANTTGALIKAGDGTLTLSSVNAHTGGTTVNGGVLNLTPGGQNAGRIRGTLTINAGGQVDAHTSWSLGYSAGDNGTTVNNIVIDGGTLNFVGTPGGGGTQAPTITMKGGTISGLKFDWYNGITSTPTLTTLASSNASVISSGINLRLNNNQATFDIADGTTVGGVDLLVSGPITSPYAGDGIIKTGAGTMALSAVNTYTGGTIVDGGILLLTSGGQNAGRIRGTLTINAGGQVDAHTSWSLGYSAGDNGTTVNNIVIDGGTLNFYGTPGGGGTQAPTITMTGGTISGLQFDWYNGITSTPTLTTLASSNASVISSGINLRLGVTNQATFDIADGTTANGVDLLVSGPITASQGGGIIKTGAGTMALSAVNTYTGATTISGGSLVLGGGGATGSLSTSSVITNNANLTINRNNAVTQGVDFSGTPLSGTGSFTQAGSGTTTLNAVNTYTGGTIVDGGVLALQGDNGANGVIRGALTINSGAEARVTAGQWAMGYDSSANFVDTITIDGGTLNFAVPAGGTNAQTFNLTGGSIIGTTFDLYNLNTATSDVAFNTLASSDTSTVSAAINMRLEGGAGGTLNFNVADGAATVDLLVSGAISGNATQNIAKAGLGTMQFSGDNTYAGTTHVMAGTLIIDGITSGQGTYTVDSGARLGGNGTIGLAGGASVDIAATQGELSPGSAALPFTPPATPGGYAGHAFEATYTAGLDSATVGDLTVSNGDVNLGGYLLVDLISPSEHDFLKVLNGDFNIGSDAQLEINGQTDLTQLNFSALGFGAGDRVDLVMAAGIDGEFLNISNNETFSGVGGPDIFFGNDGTTLYLLALPEPQSLAVWTILGLAAGIFGFLRARKKALSRSVV